MSNKFKVGDKVRRVDESDWPKDFGVKGQAYTVLDVNERGSILVIPNGIGFADRTAFELVEEAEPQYKTWGEMTDEEKGALLLAKHNGKTIQVYSRNSKTWLNVEEVPLSYCVYRVKPHEPVVKKITHYLGGYTPETKNTIVSHKYRDSTHTITFQTIDGVPDETTIKMEKLDR